MLTVLCVENDSNLRRVIAHELHKVGYGILEAADGRRGLELILKYKPDVVVSDINMPHMDGYELLLEIRNKHPEFAIMPFIFLSSLADRSSILYGLRLGADDYLTTPFDFEMLQVKIESCLRLTERFRLRQIEELKSIVIID